MEFNIDSPPNTYEKAVASFDGSKDTIDNYWENEKKLQESPFNTVTKQQQTVTTTSLSSKNEFIMEKKK